MTTFVDLRRWRIEAAPVRPDELAGQGALSPGCAAAIADGAEIILFPRIRRALLKRPRKSLKRRIACRVPSDVTER